MRTTQRLKNIQKESAKKRATNTIPQKIKNSAYISRKYKDLELGFEVEDAVETRSNAELLQDQQFLNAQIQPKLNKLFNNDGIEISEYEKYLFGNNISHQEFSQIYPELLKMGSRLLANDVIIRSQILVDNLRKNGNSTNSDFSPKIIDAIKEAKDMIENQFQSKNMSKRKGDDMTDRLDALQQIIKSSENMPYDSQLTKQQMESSTKDILDIMTQPAFNETEKIEALANTLSNLFELNKNAPKKRGRKNKTKKDDLPKSNVSPRKQINFDEIKMK